MSSNEFFNKFLEPYITKLITNNNDFIEYLKIVLILI